MQCAQVGGAGVTPVIPGMTPGPHFDPCNLNTGNSHTCDPCDLLMTSVTPPPRHGLTRPYGRVPLLGFLRWAPNQ